MKIKKIPTIFVILIICVIITIILYFIDKKLSINVFEHYSGLISDKFITHINDKKYKIDKDKKIIIKCEQDGCKEISYRYHFNTYENVVTCKDKFKTNDILRNNNIPVPSSFVVPTHITLSEFVDKLSESNMSYPLVIKDNNGTFGEHVYTNINNSNEAIQTIKQISEVRDKAIVEEQIEGDCYRVFIFNNKIIDIVKREKPYVIGNGNNIIEELIKQRNDILIDKKLYPTKNISYEYIREQGYNKNSILEKNKKIFITNIINYHNGASVSRIDINSIPSKNLDMFIDVAHALDIMCIGIDYLSTDITVDYDKNNGKILEVNGTPDTEIHTSLNKDTDTIAQNFFKYIADNVIIN